MTLESLRSWLEGTGLSETMRWSGWAWPASECLHFLGFTLLIGAVGLFDLRLLGWARELPPRAFDALLRCGITGFALCLATGVLFFVGSPLSYVGNAAFQLKLVFLALAGSNLFLFSRTVSRRVQGLDPGQTAPAGARWMAGISLLLWFAILCAGRMIAFYKP